jgi:hypothetical protein
MPVSARSVFIGNKLQAAGMTSWLVSQRLMPAFPEKCE